MIRNSSFDKTNLKLCFLVLFILETYSFFTVLAKNKTNTNFNNYLVYFLLSASLLFVLLEFSKQYANRNNQSIDKVNSPTKIQQDSLDNAEAIKEQINLFFKENTSFTDPDFNYDNFIAALPFPKKEVSIYLNQYQNTSFYQILGEERAKYAAKQLEKTNYIQ